ncbi:uncharacterized protein STEHIDRAFT_171042 [Stereum hirsutum FP-91666 SS1]|uniref:uncharacterized protein n=1 Tax=Stereum hirsutum (strain FP-91666) TaxID=721885 RepID=UPI0004449BD6|nr:uncharacterized protein STEHIDRAFT_171042 [Stereum hirsutum FP-91666 SS1]EIM82893.1 hypothetical protein STEHIDRAFT_171042 [Stereum hirsutum FP-91666 SS1]
MTTHISILPIDVLDTLSVQLNEEFPSAIGRRQFLRLPHPRTGISSLFLPYQLSQSSQTSSQWGLLEVHSITPPNSRSWFLPKSDEVLADGKMLVTTPIDVAFLLIHILRCLDSTNFRPLDDVLEEAASKILQSTPASDDPSSSIRQNDIMSLASLDCTAAAMRRMCDTQDITPEISVFRYSPDKALKYLTAKVTRLSKAEITEQSRTIVRNMAKDGLMDDGKESLLEVGRLKAACDLVSQYLPGEVYKALLATYDFSQLDEHLQSLQAEAAALALASVPPTGTKSKKGGAKNTEDEDGKKRKAKAKTTHGVEKLKKANTTGMSKISTFFQKK